MNPTTFSPASWANSTVASATYMKADRSLCLLNSPNVQLPMGREQQLIQHKATLLLLPVAFGFPLFSLSRNLRETPFSHVNKVSVSHCIEVANTIG
jgi:hypothetical protein